MDRSIIKIKIDKWGKLCDALNVSPDTDMDIVIEKAERLQEMLTDLRREKYQRDLIKAIQ